MQHIAYRVMGFLKLALNAGILLSLIHILCITHSPWERMRDDLDALIAHPLPWAVCDAHVKLELRHQRGEAARLNRPKSGNLNQMCIRDRYVDDQGDLNRVVIVPDDQAKIYVPDYKKIISNDITDQLKRNPQIRKMCIRDSFSDIAIHTCIFRD